MARNSTMKSIPLEIRNEANAKLRLSQYYNQADVREWLEEQGFSITKSAFNRYVQALRENDGNKGKSPTELIAKDACAAGMSRKEEILLELGRMRVRELALLDELREIMGQEENGQADIDGQ